VADQCAVENEQCTGGEEQWTAVRSQVKICPMSNVHPTRIEVATVRNVRLILFNNLTCTTS